ncbi:MAG: adenylate/guanylate cyclase domain-containing protein [Planctomycetota bacterium]
MLSIFVLNPKQHEFREAVDRVFAGNCQQLASLQPEIDPTEFFHVRDDDLSDVQFEIHQVIGHKSPQISLTNFGHSIAVDDGPRIHRGRKVILDLPISFRVENSQFQVFDSSLVSSIDQTLDTLPNIGSNHWGNALTADDQIAPGAATLTAWFESLSTLQKAVAGSHELFQLACRALFNPGGMDGGFVLVPSPEGWKIAASYIPFADHGICFRKELVDKAVESNATIFHDGKICDSLELDGELHSAVVSPIPVGDSLYGILYGFRSLNQRNHRRGIRCLEAKFAQVVADSIASGVIRLATEAEATRSKVLLEQVFPPKVATKLHSNPQFLQGRKLEVSVLFADMRGFSTIAEQIGPQLTYELLSNVMDEFSHVISDFDGVIIDFYGDGISAFWNAPIENKEHPNFACHTAFELLNCLKGLNQLWQDRLEREINIGIGISTGMAMVGNSGSKDRLKYGPRGSVVNLASRLETLTKQAGVPILISQETADRVTFPTRLLDSVSVKGFKSKVSVFQVFEDQGQVPTDYYEQQYRLTLTEFSNGQDSNAIARLMKLRDVYPNDGAIEYLLGKHHQSGMVSVS